VLEPLIQQLSEGKALSAAQVTDAVAALTSESISVESKAALLTALAKKGETPEEISAFAHELRARSIQPPLDAETRAQEILDVCGTGGDHLGTFNISTTVAIVCAAAGVLVAKHGNRAITSKSGSADVLEALGIRIDLSPAEAAASLRDHGFAFFFAPNYHPAFKHIAPARKLCAERGQRTIFNFLGPLLNPVRPTAQLLGVPKPELCAPLAQVLQSLDLRRGMVVCGEIPLVKQFPSLDAGSMNGAELLRVIDTDGKLIPSLSVQAACELAQTRNATLIALAPKANPPVYRLIHSHVIERLRHDDSPKQCILDELSTLGPNRLAEFYQERGFATSQLDPKEFPLQPATFADLVGGDREANAEMIREILGGTERGPKRDAVLLNSAAALFVANRVRSMSEGWELASEVIDNGKATAKLAELQQR